MAAGELAVRMRVVGRWQWTGIVGVLFVCVTGFGPDAVRADPMDLHDPRSRDVTVRFENSPADAPARLADSFTVEIPGRFELDPASGHVHVRVAGHDVEQHYFHRQRLRAGSFSDYVWVFDPASGDVVSASLSGTLVRRFDLGVLEKEIDTRFEATLSTLGRAGFATARRVFGQLLFPLCEEPSPGCTLVPATRYDASTGYVNAVGSIGGSAFGITARTFASIGEAIFSEQPARRAAGLADAR